MERQEYIDAVCVGRPLEEPNYDSESDTWELYFEESATEYHPYFTESDLLCVSFENKTDAERAYHHYSQPKEG